MELILTSEEKLAIEGLVKETKENELLFDVWEKEVAFARGIFESKDELVKSSLEKIKNLSGNETLKTLVGIIRGSVKLVVKEESEEFNDLKKSIKGKLDYTINYKDELHERMLNSIFSMPFDEIQRLDESLNALVESLY